MKKNLDILQRDMRGDTHVLDTLIAENEYLTMVLNASSEGIAVNEDQCIIYANDILEAMTGYTHNELLHLNILDLFPEEYRDRAADNISQRYERCYEAILKKKNGSLLSVDVQGKNLTFRERQLRISTFRDITDRKQVEDLYRAMADRSQVGVYIIEEGMFRYLNHSTEMYTGYSREELIGKYSVSIVHPEDRASATRSASKMLKEGGSQPHMYRIITKDKRIKWMLERVSSITYEGKRAILANTMDITEIVNARERLEELEEMEKSILDAIPHAVIGQDHRRIIFANDGVESVFGWRPEEIIGRKTRLFYRNEEDYRRIGKVFYPIYREAKTLIEEFPCIKRDGSEIICRISTSKIGDIRDRRVVVVYEDITARKNAEEKLSDYHEKLRNLASELAIAEQRERQRIATALHDGISQTMAVTKIRLKSLLKDVQDNECSKPLGEIIALIEALIRDTRSLTLDLSPPILHILGLEPALEWLAEQFQEKYDFDVNFSSDGIPFDIDKDIAFLLFRGVQELLMNIVKHAFAEKVSIAVINKGMKVSISVKDDGVGFNPSRIDTWEGLSSGYGLFSIRERLSYLGGTFRISSKPGMGTSITMGIPAKEMKEKETGTAL